MHWLPACSRAFLNELGGYLNVARMRMRGQFFSANPELLSCKLQGIDVVRRIIAEKTGATYTARGRKNAFFGPALTGLTFDTSPDVLPLNRR